MNKILTTLTAKANSRRSRLNKCVSIKDTQFVLKHLPTKKTSDPDGSSSENYQTFFEEIIPILNKLFQKTI